MWIVVLYVQNIHSWLAVVFHSVVMAFAYKADQIDLKCIFKLSNCFGFGCCLGDKNPA